MASQRIILTDINAYMNPGASFYSDSNGDPILVVNLGCREAFASQLSDYEMVVRPDYDNIGDVNVKDALVLSTAKAYSDANLASGLATALGYANTAQSNAISTARGMYRLYAGLTVSVNPGGQSTSIPRPNNLVPNSTVLCLLNFTNAQIDGLINNASFQIFVPVYSAGPTANFFIQTDLAQSATAQLIYLGYGN